MRKQNVKPLVPANWVITSAIGQAACLFHQRNPVVYEIFERLTLDAIKIGAQVGAQSVWETMRYRFQLKTFGNIPNPDNPNKPLKLNNDFVAYYARAFHLRHPKLAPYFRTRELRA